MKKLLWIILTCLLALQVTIAHADEPLPPPESYKKVIANGRYVFVMLANNSDKFLISKSGQPYLRSGMYKNDGSTSPIWTIDWYIYAGEVDVLEDGEHLVYTASNLISNNEEVAVGFYKNGKLLKKYLVSDLVKFDSLLPRTVSHMLWEKDIELDEKQNQLSIQTYFFNKYVFDIKTGQILYSFSGDLILAFIMLTLIFISLSYIIIRYIRVRKII